MGKYSNVIVDEIVRLVQSYELYSFEKKYYVYFRRKKIRVKIGENE